jgi:hypothetical protein
VKLPQALLAPLRRRVLDHMREFPPTRVIRTTAGAPYLNRWELRGNRRSFDVYLHQFINSDDQPLHDHPAPSIAIVLSGRYTERFQANRHATRTEGDIILRRSTTVHRIEIDKHSAPVITLFLRGPKLREWGFYSGRGWQHHRDFPRTRI